MMSRLKVLFLVDSVEHGGAGRVVSLLAEEFFRRGMDTSILLMDQRNYDGTGYLNLSNVKIISIFSDDVEGKIHSLTKIIRLREEFHRQKADLVIAFTTLYSIFAILASFGMKQKLVVSERVDPAVNPQNPILRILRNPLYCLTAKIVFQTEDMKLYFPPKIQRKGIVIPNPLNPKLPPAKTGEREKRIVSVGRLDSQKNYPMAIMAFDQFSKVYPEYQYEIYGEGSLNKELESLILSLGLTGKVNLMGHKSQIYQEIQNAAMFIMSSDYEGMSNALMEAMALGIPCISTDHPIGGARMLIENRVNGMLVPVNDVNGLRQAMEELASNSALCERIGTAGVKIRERLSIDKIIDVWLKICHDTFAKN